MKKQYDSEYEYLLFMPFEVIHASVIVYLPLLIVCEHLISPVNLFELLSSVLVALVLVGMVFF